MNYFKINERLFPCIIKTQLPLGDDSISDRGIELIIVSDNEYVYKITRIYNQVSADEYKYDEPEIEKICGIEELKCDYPISFSFFDEEEYDILNS